MNRKVYTGDGGGRLRAPRSGADLRGRGLLDLADVHVRARGVVDVVDGDVGESVLGPRLEPVRKSNARVSTATTPRVPMRRTYSAREIWIIIALK